MTQRLKEVLDRVSKLPSNEQDELAARWATELVEDELWDQKLKATTSDQFEKMAAQIRTDVNAGRCVEKGIDEL